MKPTTQRFTGIDIVVVVVSVSAPVIFNSTRGPAFTTVLRAIYFFVPVHFLSSHPFFPRVQAYGLFQLMYMYMYMYIRVYLITAAYMYHPTLQES